MFEKLFFSIVYSVISLTVVLVHVSHAEDIDPAVFQATPQGERVPDRNKVRGSTFSRLEDQLGPGSVFVSGQEIPGSTCSVRNTSYSERQYR